LVGNAPTRSEIDGAREGFNSGLLVPETISSEKANLFERKAENPATLSGSTGSLVVAR